MGLLWQTAEEKRKEELEEEAHKLRRTVLRKARLTREFALKKIIVFPGSKAELENFLGFETEWVNLDGAIKGLLYCTEDRNPFYRYKIREQEQILQKGIVALVDASAFHHAYTSYYSTLRTDYRHHDFFGMPVKKKD